MCNNARGEMVYNHNTGTAVFTQQPVNWYSLGSKELTAGEHTISVLTEETRSLAYDYMYHFFDVVAIVPTDWKWEPDGIIPPTVPDVSKMKPEILTWVNIADVATLEGGASVGGGDVVVNKALEEGTTVKVEIPFKAPQEGSYDIYFCGVPVGANYASPYAEYLIDGESKGAPADAKYYQSGVAAATGSSIGAGMAWQRIEQMDLDTEQHKITFIFNEKRSMDNSYIVSLRYLLLVPKDTVLNVANKTSWEVIGELAGLGIYVDETVVTDDLNLQKKAVNGTKITWSADKPEIIEADGTVNRPGYYEEDAEVVLTATVPVPYTENNQSKIYQYQKTFNLKVLKKNEYTVKDFKLCYPDGKLFGEAETGNQILTASVKVANNTVDAKKAILILALYDDQGRMVDVKSDICDATAELQSLTTEMLIEEEQTGYTAEAFVWTDMQTRDMVENAILSYSKGN